MNYHNIQGRKAGKATRDLHFRRVATKDNPINYGMTNSERNLYRKIKAQVVVTQTKHKRQRTNRLMSLLMFLRRIIGV